MTEGCAGILETDGAFPTHSFHFEEHTELKNSDGEETVRTLAGEILALLRCSNLKRRTRFPM